jgi:PD-(D/E)XK nuclease superfamily
MDTQATEWKYESPFLAGTKIQFAWDSTSLGYLKTCPRYYELTMIEGWTPKDENVHLRFGQEYHKAIEDYDKARAAGTKFDDAVRETVRGLLTRIRDWDVDVTTKVGNYKNPRSLLQLVIDYLDEYRNDVAKTFILENGQPAVELSFKFELDWGPAHQSGLRTVEVVEHEPYTEGEISWDGTTVVQQFPTSQPYILCGHLDRVVEYADALFVLDHKTTTTTPSSYYFDNFNPNNQMTLYTIASQVVYKAPVRGVIVEAAQILLDKPNKFERGTSFRTQDQLDEWIEDLRYWLSQAEAFATAGYWPMNDTACGNYGGCRYRGVCSKSPQVRKTWLSADFVQKPVKERWNPLIPRL